MSLAEPYFTALTPSISSITQTVDSVFTAETTTVIDNNTVVLSYSGVGFDITPIAMYDLGGGAYSGTVETVELFYYSGFSLMEIAEQQQLAYATIKTDFRAALLALRNLK